MTTPTGRGVRVPARSCVSTAAGQARRDEQFYYPGKFNWQFLADYFEAALFNAFEPATT